MGRQQAARSVSGIGKLGSGARLPASADAASDLGPQTSVAVVVGLVGQSPPFRKQRERLGYSRMWGWKFFTKAGQARHNGERRERRRRGQGCPRHTRRSGSFAEGVADFFGSGFDPVLEP